MGFLIFAYRKLFLKRKINDLNYRQMLISQKQQQVTEQTTMLGQAFSAAKTMMGQLSSGSIYSAQQDILKQYTDENGRVNIPADQQAQISQQLMAKQYAAMQMSSAANSIFESANNAMLAPINALDTQLDMEMASIESQLKTLRSELESVEKGESEAAKSCAPKFGLS